MSLAKRAFAALNLEQYNTVNSPELIGKLNLPIDETLESGQHVLRMLIKEPFSSFKIPDSLMWAKIAVDLAYTNQLRLGIRQPFCYITVRSGTIQSTTDDEWHVDGFSMNITHLPEQNYIWTSNNPTEYVEKPISFPSDFDPFKHNIHSFIAKSITEQDEIKTILPNYLYALDPYVPHRRPTLDRLTKRVFLRISFTPIEINDINNTQNFWLPRIYTRDGIKDFRQSLIDYE